MATTPPVELSAEEEEMILALRRCEQEADPRIHAHSAARESGHLRTPVPHVAGALGVTQPEQVKDVFAAVRALIERKLLSAWAFDTVLDPVSRQHKAQPVPADSPKLYSVTLTEEGAQLAEKLNATCERVLQERRRQRSCPACGASRLTRGRQTSGLMVHMTDSVTEGVRVFADCCLECGLVSFYVRFGELLATSPRAFLKDNARDNPSRGKFVLAMPPTTKSELRRRLLARRDALDPETIAHRSALIHRRLFALDLFRRARTVAFFVATRSEVRTLPMIQEALASGRRVVVPRTILEDRSLRLKEIRHPDADLAPGTLGILEPAAGAPEVPVSEVDLFLVPGAVWDHRGYRIGYGGGFYDRLLVQSPDTPRVGLAFELQVVNRLPEQAHDTPVDWLVTERRVYRFSRPGR